MFFLGDKILKFKIFPKIIAKIYTKNFLLYIHSMISYIHVPQVDIINVYSVVMSPIFFWFKFGARFFFSKKATTFLIYVLELFFSQVRIQIFQIQFRREKFLKHIDEHIFGGKMFLHQRNRERNGQTEIGCVRACTCECVYVCVCYELDEG